MLDMELIDRQIIAIAKETQEEREARELELILDDMEVIRNEIN